MQDVAFKSNYQEFKDILERHGITKLYHFTDRDNLESIIRNGGLYSWADCESKSIGIKKPGGDDLSRHLDRRRGLQNFVRVSFVSEHPMMHVAKNYERISNPIILEIDPQVIYWQHTQYADRNAAKAEANVGEDLSDFNAIHFDTVKTSRYLELDTDERPFFQAEVLVKNHIPLKYITNIGNFGISIPNQPNELTPLQQLTFTVNGITFEMIPVEGGTFTMGATAEQGDDVQDDEKPAHQVTLSDFAIGKHEVTQALWSAVMDHKPRRIKGDDHPAEYISWEDCQDFIRKLNALTGKNFCLPTEAEWEFAARGGTRSKGYKYSGSDNLDEVAWYSGNSGHQTHPVGTKKPNELGIYDMSGNVYEWCADWYGNYSSPSSSNPTGSTSGSSRLGRGGCCRAGAKFCRISYRCHGNLEHGVPLMGIRLVLHNFRI